jgi:tRNA-splicing ligase RtcB
MQMTVSERIVAFGDVDGPSRDQLGRCLDVSGETARGVLCADHHKGYSMPIGGVVASSDVVMPAGVGYDIACGNCAVRTNIQATDSKSELSRIMDEIWRVISFGVGRKNDERIAEHHVFDVIAASPVGQQRALLSLAQSQLGTVGSGNHYVDLFEDRADGRLWVGVHFGSRGFGHKTACGFLALAAGKDWNERVDDSMDAPPTTIPLGTPLADDYLAAMGIAGEYAYAGRNWAVDRVLAVLGASDTLRVHNHHNFAWWETHQGRRVLVIRKGATPAVPGQQGFIGGSMGDDAVIVEGLESAASADALYSTVHGAGRVMSRTAAAGKTKLRKSWRCGERACDYAAEVNAHRRGEQNSRPACPKCGTGRLIEHKAEEMIRAGAVNWPAWQARLKAQGVELRGGGADEAPQCYKHLPDVLAAHAGTIRVLHTLRPIGVAMAGRETFDPYKD